MNDFCLKETCPIVGCLLGTAVGDSLGLPAEGLNATKARRFFRNGVRHRLVFGRGMLSDDTEQSLMVANALIKHSLDAYKVQKALGRSLRWWMAALPAGVGLSTAKAIAKLWIGFPASCSGVRSAGNGAAMRSAVIGVFWANDSEKRREFARAACIVTHTDLRAIESALLVAEAAALAARHVPTNEVLERLSPLLASEEMHFRWDQLLRGLEAGDSVEAYAASIGCERGVSGFAPNTVAVSLFAWLRHRGDFAESLSQVIFCGGDTDSVAAITGAICGAECRMAGIPRAWINGIADWPRSVSCLEEVAKVLASARTNEVSLQPPSLVWPAIPARNAVFLLIVLAHGFRRLLPF